jgi:hypothetical protein
MGDVLACRHAYTKNNGSPGVFTLYIEHLYLITPECLPKDNDYVRSGL